MLAQPTISWSATIPVVDGAVAIVPNGDCSLIEAIENANNNAQTHGDCAPGGAGEDTVALATNGAYAFDITTTDVPISSTVMIDGNNATLTHSDAGFFDISSAGFLKLTNATLKGSAGNSASAISGEGSLFIAGCTVEENVNQTNSGGAVKLSWATSNQSAEFRHSIFRNNVSAGSGGAIYINASSPSVTGLSVVLDQMTFESNGRWVFAGGIESLSGGALNVGGDAAASPFPISIDNSRFDSNHAGSGGAINVTGESVNLTIDRSTFDNNSAKSQGGAIRNNRAVTNVMRSLFSQNSTSNATSYGGAVQNFKGTVTIENSTFSGNVSNRGGAIRNYATDIDATESVMVLVNVTMTGNEARTVGGAIYNHQAGTTTAARINLQNTLILGNTAPTANLDCLNGGIMQSFGYNVKNGSALAGCSYSGTGTGDVSATGTASTDIFPTLADNGGATLTHAIPIGSEARNIIPVNVNGCVADYVDQRGRLRNSGNGTTSCDAGAYEYGALTVKCDDGLIVDYQALTGAPTPFEATSSVTLGPSLSIDGTDIEVNAPTVSFISSTTIDGLFKAGNVTSCP